MFLLKKSILIFCLFSLTSIQAEEFISAQCQPLQENNLPDENLKHSKGMLWQIVKDGKEASYVFGTIHISDEEVTTLPEVVEKALNDSGQFVMEALPDTEQLMSFSKAMFFIDGQRLSNYLDEAVYEKTKEILASYHLASEAVSVIQPWAAFLVMNYPPDTGQPLDMVLLSIAQQNGIAVAGLETLTEQEKLFTELDLDEQVTLLTDTVCHYETVEKDFAAMKSFYLERDLAGLYYYAQRYSLSNKPVYQKLMKKLIDDRNKTMVNRMQAMLDEGNVFIAIGAMHLVGDKGVLTLLEKQGYSISSVY